jgi:hypothetical protein
MRRIRMTLETLRKRMDARFTRLERRVDGRFRRIDTHGRGVDKILVRR